MIDKLLTIGLEHFLILSGTLFFIGLFAVLSKKNVIAVLMGIEIMFTAVNINLIAFNRYTAAEALLTGHVFAIFVIALAAAEVAVGLALIISIYRLRTSTDVQDYDWLKW